MRWINSNMGYIETGEGCAFTFSKKINSNMGYIETILLSLLPALALLD